MKKRKENSEQMVNESAGALGFIEKNANIIAAILVAITAIMGIFLFNMRIDEGGDDSTYITRAIDLVASGTYPTYQGPMYPIFLAVFVWIFGARLVVLKATSLLLIITSQLIFYKVLRNRVNVRLVLAVMALMSINSWLLFFGCMTYSEALYIVVEYAAIGFIMRLESREYSNPKKTWINAALAAMFVVVAYLIRTVGFGFGIAGIAYLLICKKPKKAIMFVASIIAVGALWFGLRTAIWGDIKQDNRQLESLMQVHPYQIEDGQETVSGYFGRLIDNSNLYVSKHLMRIVGLRKAEDRATNPAVTIFVYLLFAYGAFEAWRKNRCILMLAITSAVMLGITFVVLQAIWDQFRLIIPYVGIALMVILYGLGQICKHLFGRKAPLICLVLVGMCGILTMSQSLSKIDLQILRKNLSGDMLYGFTPDWYNYLSICQKVYEELPEESYVACRKPNMARIYAGGQKFYGIYNFESEDADELLDNLRDRKVTHIIAASLRKDPMIPNGDIINTIHRYMGFIAEKYPHIFTLVGQCGDADSEPTYLFAIDYNYADKIKAKMEEAQ